jgi:hypothetical protein
MVAPFVKLIQLLNTGLLFLAVMAAMLVALDHGILAAMLLSAGGLDAPGPVVRVPARLRAWLVLRLAMGEQSPGMGAGCANP